VYVRNVTKTAAMAGQTMSIVVACTACDSCWRLAIVVELDNMPGCIEGRPEQLDLPECFIPLRASSMI
jgi:hypothetical protein